MATTTNIGDAKNGAKKQIILNAFDMSTVGHLSPGQWKVGILIQPYTIEALEY